MSETTGVLAGTITTAALNSAIGYMTPERCARLAHAARQAARDRPALVAGLAAIVSFLAVRTVRVALSGHAAPASGGRNGAR